MSSTRTSRNKSGNTGANHVNQKLARLECLVDEMVRHNPCEHRIRAYMEEAGLVYITDPIERMNVVLTMLNRIRGRGGEAVID